MGRHPGGEAWAWRDAYINPTLAPPLLVSMAGEPAGAGMALVTRNLGHLRQQHNTAARCMRVLMETRGFASSEVLSSLRTASSALGCGATAKCQVNLLVYALAAQFPDDRVDGGWVDGFSTDGEIRAETCQRTGGTTYGCALARGDAQRFLDRVDAVHERMGVIGATMAWDWVVPGRGSEKPTLRSSPALDPSVAWTGAGSAGIALYLWVSYA